MSTSLSVGSTHISKNPNQRPKLMGLTRAACSSIKFHCTLTTCSNNTVPVQRAILPAYQKKIFFGSRTQTSFTTSLPPTFRIDMYWFACLVRFSSLYKMSSSSPPFPILLESHRNMVLHSLGVVLLPCCLESFGYSVDTGPVGLDNLVQFDGHTKAWLCLADWIEEARGGLS